MSKEANEGCLLGIAKAIVALGDYVIQAFVYTYVIIWTLRYMGVQI